MKQIEQLGNSLFAHLSRKEAKELKQELRSHLLVTVRELKEEGESEQEAFALAIDRFKAENKGPLTKFQLQKQFAKWLLCSAILLVLVGLFFAANLFMRDKSYGEITALMEHLGQIYLTKDDFTFEDELALQEGIQRNSTEFKVG
ncbi:permease prefix domain 1-containing protein [Sporosarcina cyprini]|uniref:permease prefix domain 1-containing protein n=1 Tax=Sporosarcina cyprini TaxID=2910523 RepID=UPI001EDCB57A|nr:permease prefix domain 1-containing protein [Sporosarcina cyprini]MCG3086665.1 permease prefix domain 1-containing protein [Sporosarcina cyprini]